MVGLGLWTWFSGGSRPSKPRTEPSFVRAVLANVLNPKAAAIYLTLVPQFVNSSRYLDGGIHSELNQTVDPVVTVVE